MLAFHALKDLPADVRRTILEPLFPTRARIYDTIEEFCNIHNYQKSLRNSVAEFCCSDDETCTMMLEVEEKSWNFMKHCTLLLRLHIKLDKEEWRRFSNSRGWQTTFVEIDFRKLARWSMPREIRLQGVFHPDFISLHGLCKRCGQCPFAEFDLDEMRFLCYPCRDETGRELWLNHDMLVCLYQEFLKFHVWVSSLIFAFSVLCCTAISFCVEVCKSTTSAGWCFNVLLMYTLQWQLRDGCGVWCTRSLPTCISCPQSSHKCTIKRCSPNWSERDVGCNSRLDSLLHELCSLVILSEAFH